MAINSVLHWYLCNNKGCQTKGKTIVAKAIKDEILDNPDKKASQDLASLESIMKLQVKSEFEGVSKNEHKSMVEKSEKGFSEGKKVIDKPDIILPSHSDKQESHSQGANDNEECMKHMKVLLLTSLSRAQEPRIHLVGWMKLNQHQMRG